MDEIDKALKRLDAACDEIRDATWTTRAFMFQRCDSALRSLSRELRRAPLIDAAIVAALDAIGIYTFQLDCLGRDGDTTSLTPLLNEAVNRVELLRSTVEILA